MQVFRRVFPLQLTFLELLVVVYAFYEGLVVDAEEIADASAHLFILRRLRRYRIHDHFAVLAGRPRHHRYPILGDVIEALLR